MVVDLDVLFFCCLFLYHDPSGDLMLNFVKHVCALIQVVFRFDVDSD